MKEKNKILIFGLCYIIIAIFVFLMLSQIQYEKYTNQMNIVIAEIVDKIVEKYPDIEEEEIIKILNDRICWNTREIIFTTIFSSVDWFCTIYIEWKYIAYGLKLNWQFI